MACQYRIGGSTPYRSPVPSRSDASRGIPTAAKRSGRRGARGLLKLLRLHDAVEHCRGGDLIDGSSPRTAPPSAISGSLGTREQPADRQRHDQEDRPGTARPGSADRPTRIARPALRSAGAARSRAAAGLPARSAAHGPQHGHDASPASSSSPTRTTAAWPACPSGSSQGATSLAAGSRPKPAPDPEHKLGGAVDGGQATPRLPSASFAANSAQCRATQARYGTVSRLPRAMPRAGQRMPQRFGQSARVSSAAGPKISARIRIWTCTASATKNSTAQRARRPTTTS